MQLFFLDQIDDDIRTETSHLADIREAITPPVSPLEDNFPSEDSSEDQKKSNTGESRYLNIPRSHPKITQSSSADTITNTNSGES